MKVGILLMNKGRGSGVVAKEHADFLIKQGHSVFFIQPEIGEGIKRAININVSIHSPVLPVHEYLPSAKKNQKAVSTMTYEEAFPYVADYEKALEEVVEALDIVIGHHGNLTAIATASICEKYNKPYVLFLHGTGIEPRQNGQYDDKIWDLIEKAIKKANGIIVTTEYVRDSLVKNLVDVTYDKFLIQPCGVDLNEFNSSNTNSIRKKYNLPEKYVICPGALSHLKGPQNVVNATKYYADLAMTVFIGDGDLREELEIQLKDRGRFLGFVSNEDKARLINASTILTAAPEKKEHFGIIYTEAMSGSVPVVAYEGGGVNSIVTTESGVLTERNSKALGGAIRALLLDDERQQTMRIKSRERAEKLYATDVLGPKLISWLQSFLK